MVLAPQEDGFLPFFVHYRTLNVVTVKDGHLILQVDERQEWLGEAWIFLALDANSR